MNPKDRAGSKKPNLSILPLRPLYEVALALYEGARKYGPWNWRAEKVDETIYVDAAIRHLNQWIAGEDIDPDSGLPHISKAIAGLVILRDAQHHGCSIDTRRAKQNVDFPDLVARLDGINQKYPVPVAAPPVEESVEDQISRAIREQAIKQLDKQRENRRKQQEEATAARAAEAEAEKAGEYYGFQEAAQKFSLAAAGGGSYQIKPEDLGKRVLRRDGVAGKIAGFDDPIVDEFPVHVAWDGGSGSFCSTDGINIDINAGHSIAKVIH